MNFRVADVTKPLGAVSQNCHKGNKVVFDVEGSYTKHKATPGRRSGRRGACTCWTSSWPTGAR